MSAPARVLGVPAAGSHDAQRWFGDRLRFETDPYDVHHDLTDGEAGIVLLDARTRAAYAGEHIAGAISLPHREMTAETLDALDPDSVYVTYGWGPACNAGVRAALHLAGNGLRVKEMIGGLEYWVRQGLPVERGER